MYEMLQVTALVEQKLETKDLDKYRLYVDELDKVLYLLLRISDRLAKAENAIWALPQNASDKEKVRAQISNISYSLEN